MSEPTHPDPELEQLRQRHPGWTIQVSWVSSASAVDLRVFHADDTITVIIAYSPASLDAQIGQAERGL